MVSLCVAWTSLWTFLWRIIRFAYSSPPLCDLGVLWWQWISSTDKICFHILQDCPHTACQILLAYHSIRYSSASGVWAVFFFLSKSAFAFLSLTRTFDILLFRIIFCKWLAGRRSQPDKDYLFHLLIFRSHRFIVCRHSASWPFLVPIFLSVHIPLGLPYKPVRWGAPVTLQGFS